MRAAYVIATGPPEAIRVGDLPVPVVGPLDVLVRTQALAVNYVDTLIRAGRYRTPMPFPFVIGRDLVGTVEAVGAGVDAVRAGDAVWSNSLGHGGRQGSFADFALVPGDRLYPLPAAVDPVEAVAVLHPAATACLALFREGHLRYGERVLVSGAGGAVGTAAVQLASAAGARVFAIARAEDADWCRGAGAEAVFDYRDPAVWDRIAAAVPGGIDVFLETSRHYAFDRTLPLLARGGRFVLITGIGATVPVPLEALYLRDASLRGFVISNAPAADLAWAASMINDGLSRGLLRVRIGTRLPLDAAAEAHRLVEAGTRGRVVVTM